jgi:hypothetical protein
LGLLLGRWGRGSGSSIKKVHDRHGLSCILEATTAHGGISELEDLLGLVLVEFEGDWVHD